MNKFSIRLRLFGTFGAYGLAACCSRTAFRPTQLLQDDISTCPAAAGLHFDMSSCSRTIFQPFPLLRDGISTTAAAPGPLYSTTAAATAPVLVLQEGPTI